MTLENRVRFAGVGIFVCGLGVGTMMGAGAAFHTANQQIKRDVHTMQEQNATIERLTRAHAECSERFTGVTVIYGPAQYDITDRLPRNLIVGMNLLLTETVGSLGRVRLLVSFPDRPARTLMALPVKIQPVASGGNPYTFAWFNRSGKIAGPSPVTQGAPGLEEAWSGAKP